MHIVSKDGSISVFRHRSTQTGGPLRLIGMTRENRSSPKEVTGKWLLKN